MATCINICLFYLGCSGSVRLVDGGSRCAGRVEVLHRGQWGTVCGNGWDMRHAAVVCRELRCGEAVDALSDAHFGSGSGPIWMSKVDCGNESQIHFCPTSSSLKHNCSHDIIDTGLVCAGSVRLVDGSSRCDGRVEVLHRGQWGTVCGNSWDMRHAAVVCGEMGCEEALHAFNHAYFGPGSGPIWMNNVYCSGSESTLKNCISPGWGKHDCDHNKDAGVICRVRLVGGSHCSGRVEVLHGDTWSTVCDADFDQQDAEVVCRELGCGLPVEVLGAAAFGKGEGQVWSEEFQCRGNESQIHSCPTSSSLKHNCSHDNDVGVVCAGISLEQLW
uniref:SRCR domain-containing protein n=1 Tax=Pygocentrus nattereri TaxID=42514 RepID=A0A3B4BLW3_PYGNA